MLEETRRGVIVMGYSYKSYYNSKWYMFIDRHFIFCELWEDIEDTFDTIKSWVRCSISGIKNFISYIPITWKDRPWDHYFFWKLLQFKLQKMYDFFSSDKTMWAECKEKTNAINNLKLCLILLDRIIKDDYYEIAFRQHEKRWGIIISKVVDSDKEGCSQLLLYRENCKGEHEKKLEREQTRRLFKHEEYLRKQDINLLFTTIAKNIQKWWD
jgi:hypothetical protein